MFIVCEICGKEIFENHIEFHMAEHVGMNVILRMMQNNQEEKSDENSTKDQHLDLLLNRIGFRRSVI